MPLEPAVAQVAPLWVIAFDQRNLFLTPPVFELFFTCNGSGHRRVALKKHEARDVVFCGERSWRSLFMLKDSPFQVAGNADVQNTALAAQDVNVVGFLHECKGLPGARSMPVMDVTDVVPNCRTAAERDLTAA